jgi:L-seryl-tRNA(Ser) seleniumtransferase
MTLRSLPSVDRLLQTETASQLVNQFGRPLMLEAIRASLDSARLKVQEGGSPPSSDILLEEARRTLLEWTAPTLRPVINATGVIVHTNLGRAPLSQAARQAMMEVAQGYCNLEFNLEQGRRGKREQHCEELLRHLTGAEAALIVNNNAAAVLLALTALAKRKAVLISRSQLIEIGGGFRIPDVMRFSGAKLVEVGTTNRTHLKDFETALDERTALILQAHHSNFKIVGFTTEPSLGDLAQLGRQHGIPVMHDLGSGALLDTAQFGLGHEPTAQESLQQGAAIVAFSGDKLLGGPQAGILIGTKLILDKLRKHPLARAVRPDKLCLAGLSKTLMHYLQDEALEEIPIWRMISAPGDVLLERVKSWRTHLDFGEIVEGRSTVGGGSLPEETLPTWLLALAVRSPNDFAKRLRQEPTPIITRIDENRVLLDPRTVLHEEEQTLLDLLTKHMKELR